MQAYHRLLWDEVCTLQDITYQKTTYAANKTAVEALCSVQPGCVYLGVEDYATSKQYESDPTRNCAASLLAVRISLL